MKDFIIHPYQVMQAEQAGADPVPVVDIERLKKALAE